MGLQQIDAVDLQPLEAGLGRAQDVVLLQALAFAHVVADLGGDHDLGALAARFEPVADDGFRLAALVALDPARIGVGGVDGVEAGVDEGVEQGERGRLVDVPAEHIAAQHQRRDVEIGVAEAAFHGCYTAYRSEALNFSSAAWPGQSSFSPSALSGPSTVRRCACRSSESFST